MASKTGRTWLDCKNPQNADIFLHLAVKVKENKNLKVAQQTEIKNKYCFKYSSHPQSLESLYSKLTSRTDSSSDTTLSKEDVEKDLLRVLSFQAESVSRGIFDVQHLRCECLFLWYLAAWAVLFWQAFPVMCETVKSKKQKQWERQSLAWTIGEMYILHTFLQALCQGNNTGAVAYVQRCKDMLLRLPKDVREASLTSCCCCYKCIFGGLGDVPWSMNVFFVLQTAYLSLMCYNFGVDTFNMKKFEDSAIWLR